MASASNLPCEEQFHCSICSGTFTKVISTPGGHNYCKTCVTAHWDTTGSLQCRSIESQKNVGPLSNPEDRVCKKHGQLLNFFCHTDEKGVCSTCLKDEHVAHVAVPLEQAFQKTKAKVELMTSRIEMLEIGKAKSVYDTKCSKKQSKETSEKDIAEIDEVFAALAASLQRRRAELIELILQKQKAAEKQAEGRVARLEREAAELRRRRSEMEQILQSEDRLHLLENCPPFHLPLYLYNDRPKPQPDSASLLTQDLSGVSHQVYAGKVKKSVAQIERTLSMEMEALIQGVRLSDDDKPMMDDVVKEVWSPPQDKLMMIQQCDAVNVTLDPNTAHSKFTVSEDGKQVTLRKGLQFFPTLFGRKFECGPFVLATDGYSSGRFYYEVQVSGSNGWILGVVKESIDRATFFFPTTDDGAWVFHGIKTQYQDRYCANTVDGPLPNIKQRPQTVGVSVDYEKGEISFYDVDARTLIYSFTECSFTESVAALKAFLYTMAGTSCSGRPKLYPIFGMFGEDSDNTLLITPVGGTT
ncbi:E3 ubiquitin-protein ligase TRIM39-like [Odontesthes bonariensis]|uniref:E3 ubiquitin-protein ligase TRIM39-like n=1 Tax=Odontesthes bonariensis TaxID=219752 RepID=UPI003F5882C9